MGKRAVYTDRLDLRVSPQLKRRITHEARRRGLRIVDVVRAVLSDALMLDHAETERAERTERGRS